MAPGERKRLTVGVELVSNAPVIFLDEPTSGLDSRAAAVVMRVVKRIANTGRTVICTIHQPSAELFFLFDDLLLLQKGGWPVFFGPIGESGKLLIEYLQGVAGFPPCPQGLNPASYMLENLAGAKNINTLSKHVGDTTPPDSSTGVTAVVDDSSSASASASASDEPKKDQDIKLLEGSLLSKSLLASEQWKSHASALEEYSKPAPNTSAIKFDRIQARTFSEQYTELVKRTWKCYERNIGLNYGRMVALLGLNILFGVVYYKLAPKSNSVGGVQSIVAAVFMTCAFAAMLNQDASLPVLIKQRSTFYREQASRMYDSLAYSFALTTVEIPWLAFIILVVTPIPYYMLGLVDTAGNFFYHYLCTFILALVFVSLGQLVSASMPTFDAAQAFVGFIAPLFFLFGGLFSPVSSMPVGSRWFTYCDPIYYAFKAVMPPQFYCTGADCPTISAVTATQGIVVLPKTTYVEQLYELKYSERWEHLGYLCIFIGVIQVLAWYQTRYRRYIVR